MTKEICKGFKEDFSCNDNCGLYMTCKCPVIFQLQEEIFDETLTGLTQDSKRELEVY